MIQKFQIQETAIQGLYQIQPFCATDSRGSFTKDFSISEFSRLHVKHELLEVFYTTSAKGVIRALHFQKVKQQPKLVRCITGHVWDVVVDLRRESPTYKHWLSFDLFGDNKLSILIPERCAHGYLVLEDSIVSYKCGEQFYSDYDAGVYWDDPDIGVQWPLDLIGGRDKLIISDKDMALPLLSEIENSLD